VAAVTRYDGQSGVVFRPMDGRQARKGANEARFRDVNERLERRSAERVAALHEFDAICECADENCTDRITIAFDDYERIRARPTSFLVRTGHGDSEVEHVLRRRASYEVVEKIGDAAAVAELEDRRSADAG
jgi:hypothetical protein